MAIFALVAAQKSIGAVARFTALGGFPGVPLHVRLVGGRAYAQHMRRARSRFRKEQKSKIRIAAKVLQAHIRKEIKTVFSAQGHRSGTHLLSRKTSVSVRSKRTVVRATVGPKGIAAAYGVVHEKGLTVERKSRSGGTHSATYPKRPFVEPAVKKSAPIIFKIIGKTFKVV